MKRLLLTLVVLALASSGASAADVSPAEPVSKLPVSDAAERLPGVALAEGISQITGVAISPLLGTSAMGAWRYYRTPSEFRGRLPWFCHPAVWGFCFGLLAICFLKDTLGTATPTVLKKPLDLLELFEDKLSAIIASAAIIPLVASQIAQAFAEAPPASSTLSSDIHYGSVVPLAISLLDLRLLFIPLSLFAFAVVWITSHAVNVLIVLSPFGILDAALKLIKTSVLSLVAVACLINPFLGAALSLLIICLAAWIAPHAFRFAVFGTLLALDLLMPWRARRLATPDEAHVFTTRRLSGISTRTFGRLSRSSEGRLQFSYRPWVILGRRTIDLPPEPVTLARGLLYPSVLQPIRASSTPGAILVFLPRYRGHEEVLAGRLGAREIREHSMARGFAAVRAWLAETFGSRTGRLGDLARSPAA